MSYAHELNDSGYCFRCGKTFTSGTEAKLSACHIIIDKGVPPIASSHDDLVNHPKHYTQHPSGVECIAITEHYNFCRGNALKYIWRADLKNGIEDLKKARWYLDREIARMEKESKK